MRNSFTAVLLAGFAVFWSGDPVRAAIAGLERVASGLSSPIFVTRAPGDRDRLFIVERGTPVDDNQENSTANIRILDLNTGAMLATPFLSIPGLDIGGEGGLLGMAFHPDYDSNGKFYVYVTANDSIASTPFSSYVREYTVSTENPNVADSTFDTVITWGQPQSNHNAGWIGFSPIDGYLYIASGDGGGGNDSGTGHTSGSGNAQDITSNRLGKILRIDVNNANTDDGLAYDIPPDNPFVGATGDDEIWAYGLRNPFRNSFDRLTGDLWIGDVGQDNREEIDFQPASSTGGENYGWRLREGNIATPTGGVGGECEVDDDCVEPIYSYTHPDTTVPPVSPAGFTGTFVTGGYVYRGPDPSLQGKYFFLDAGGNNNWMVDSNPFETVMNIDSLLTPDVGTASFPVSFGEDEIGNLYIVYAGSGAVYRIATDEVIAGDYDGDGVVDVEDYAKWKEDYGMAGENLASDGNGDGVVDAGDYVRWRNNLGNRAQDVVPGAGGLAGVPEPAALTLFAQIAAIGLLHRRRRGTIRLES